MSDATGSGAGGASTVFKAAGSDKSCDTKDPGMFRASPSRACTNNEPLRRELLVPAEQ